LRIEIFVVTTELEKLNRTLQQTNQRLESYIDLLKCKNDLTRLFGGLTEIDFKGFWLNHKTNTIDSDKGKLWLIYTEQKEEELNNILLRIKEITQQNCQVYAINDGMYCI